MNCYLLGPSGVGKTTLGRDAAFDGVIIYVDLDERIRTADPALFHHGGERWPDFWRASVGIMREFERKFPAAEPICLIDVGAGSLETEEALDFFRTARHSLLIHDRPERAFARARKRGGFWQCRSFTEYRESEFSEKRQRIYGTATRRAVVTDLELDEASACVRRELIEMQENHRRIS